MSQVTPFYDHPAPAPELLLLGTDPGAGDQPVVWMHIPAGTPLRDVEDYYIRATLQHHNGDRRKAAAALGISLKTLYNRLPVAGKGDEA